MAIVNGYCSLAEIKASARITDSVDDALLELAVEAASRMVDSYTQRYFYNAGTATRLFVPQDSYVTEIDDSISISVLQTSDGETFGTTWATKDYQLEPLNSISEGLTWPFTRIRAVDDYDWSVFGDEATAKITGVWGWPAVPASISQAAVIQGSRIFTRLQSPLGIAGFGDMGVVRVSRQLDPDVAQLVEPFRRMRGIA